MGLQEGLQQARRKRLLGIDALIDVRFGSVGRTIMPEIEKVEDMDLLERIPQQSKTATSPDELRSLRQPVA